jgi:hypothetical protein
MAPRFLPDANVDTDPDRSAGIVAEGAASVPLLMS